MTAPPSAREHRFVHVDVFTDHARRGDPLAGVLDGTRLAGAR